MTQLSGKIEKTKRAEALQKGCEDFMNRFVFVQWLAPRFIDERLSETLFSPALMYVRTWGRLIAVEDDCIAVAQNDYIGFRASLQGIMVIPLVCIQDIQRMDIIKEDNV